MSRCGRAGVRPGIRGMARLVTEKGGECGVPSRIVVSDGMASCDALESLLAHKDQDIYHTQSNMQT